VTLCGVLICVACGFFAGIVPTLAEAGPVTRVALNLSFGRWSLQCLASADFSRVPNALYAHVGSQLVEAAGWPTADELAARGHGECDVPLTVLACTGLALRLLGALALVACNRDQQHKAPLCTAGGCGGDDDDDFTALSRVRSVASSSVAAPGPRARRESEGKAVRARTQPRGRSPRSSRRRSRGSGGGGSSAADAIQVVPSTASAASAAPRLL